MVAGTRGREHTPGVLARPHGRFLRRTARFIAPGTTAGMVCGRRSVVAGTADLQPRGACCRRHPWTWEASTRPLARSTATDKPPLAPTIRSYAESVGPHDRVLAETDVDTRLHGHVGGTVGTTSKGELQRWCRELRTTARWEHRFFYYTRNQHCEREHSELGTPAAQPPGGCVFDVLGGRGSKLWRITSNHQRFCRHIIDSMTPPTGSRRNRCRP